MKPKNKISVSYAILTHNEGQYIDRLLEKIIQWKDPIDEIIVVDDFSTDALTQEILAKYKDEISLYQNALNGDFAAQKNFLQSKCNNDWIFQIDADELPHDTLISFIKDILATNHALDMLWVPRMNIVNGITEEYIKEQGWTINNRGFVNWSDLQGRIYRNSPAIKWEGAVHEKLVGFKQYAFLPENEEWGLWHIKEFDRQKAQNELYKQIQCK